MIVARNLSKRYGSFYALKDISFEVGREKVALLGPNGSGKTTLARMVAGITKPSRGDLTVLGKRPWESSEIRGRIGIVTHNPMLYSELTVRENLEFYSRLYGCKIGEIVDLLGLRDKLDKRVSSLSMGWVRRVAIARALMNDPEVLVVDEGTSGLDPEAKSKILDLLRNFGGCLLFSTHNVAEASFCDRYIVLDEGRIVYDGESWEDAAANLR